MTSNNDYAADVHYGAQVLLECNKFDPWMPDVNENVAASWGYLIRGENLDLDNDVIPAIHALYRTRTSGFRILPGDIIATARELHAGRLAQRSRSELEAAEDARDRARFGNRLKAVTPIRPTQEYPEHPENPPAAK